MKDIENYLKSLLIELDLTNHDDLIRYRLIIEILDYLKNGKN